MEIDEIQAFEPIDEGRESEPTVNDVTAPADAEPVAETDSADEASTNVSTTEKGAETPATGEEASDDKSEEEESEKTLEESLADVEKEIANEKHPKWFRANLKSVKTRYERATEEIRAQFEPLKDYGEVPKIVEQLELTRGLDAIATNPATGLPERTVKPFVEKIVEARGYDTGRMLAIELLNLPSPDKKGWTLQHEMLAANGIDPTRLDDFQRFAANGYQFGNSENPPPDPSDLALVPENLREAFVSLDPQKRDEMLNLSPETMEIALGGVQTKLDADRAAKAAEATQAETEARQKLEEEQTFHREVNERAAVVLDESGSKLFNSFTETLVKADIDKFDAIAIANTVSMVLNNGGIESRAAREALGEIGVKLDSSIDTIFGEWLQTAHHVATFEKRGDKEGYQSAFNKLNDLQNQLTRKAAPIVKAIVEHRAAKAAERVELRNTLLDQAKKQTNGLAATAGSPRAIATNGNGRKVWSDEERESVRAFE